MEKKTREKKKKRWNWCILSKSMYIVYTRAAWLWPLAMNTNAYSNYIVER